MTTFSPTTPVAGSSVKLHWFSLTFLLLFSIHLHKFLSTSIAPGRPSSILSHQRMFYQNTPGFGGNRGRHILQTGHNGDNYLSFHWNVTYCCWCCCNHIKMSTRVGLLWLTLLFVLCVKKKSSLKQTLLLPINSKEFPELIEHGYHNLVIGFMTVAHMQV